MDFGRHWGKARPPASGDGPAWHPLVLHSFDVVAVAQAYLRRADRFRRYWAGRFGWSEDTLTEWSLFFIALHDLGKFSASFQNLRPDLLRKLQDGRVHVAHESIRHDSLGAMVWGELGGDEIAALFGTQFEAADQWIAAVTGHHGQPPRSGGALQDHFKPQDLQAVHDFAGLMAARFLSERSREAWRAVPTKALRECSRQYSWWLAGLTVLADWLGSNTDFFSYSEAPADLDPYWNHSCRQAESALAASGVLPQRPAPTQSLPQLCGIADATPLQQQAQDLALADGPQLFVLEDVTGAGKTEAAVLLAHRLLAAGQGDGLYFALPTQATANQMYERLSVVYERLFEPGSQPSLVLAHSARDLSAAFRASVIPDYPDPEPQRSLEGDEQTASQRCTAWLADQRKAALLAQVGVGTVDQALIGALPVRHQSLRLLGLFGKVLIVDEVHACDAYMLGLLKSLLRFHHAAGGSAILLSATLPAHMRAELCAIYQPDAEPRSLAYPLLSHAAASGLSEYPVPTRAQVRRTVRIEWLRSLDECRAVVLAAARRNEAVCWLRNTVREATQAHAQLKPDWEQTELFHARFALADRLAIETAALNRFGRQALAEERAGHVLVATQVVEQSLDLDFDCMVTDLAPIDLLIQRAGRLHRHARGPRGEPVLYVLSPEARGDAEDGWLGAELRSAGLVYNAARLWLGCWQLQQQGSLWRMPEDARAMIEAVYGDSSIEQLPAGLQRVASSGEGQSLAASGSARTNSLRLELGYREETSAASDWWNDARTPTRLGEPSVTLHLLIWQDGRLRDYSDEPDPRRAAGLSRVSVRETWIKRLSEPTDPALRAALEDWRSDPRGGREWVVPVVLAPEAPDGSHHSAVMANGGSARVRYSRESGLEAV